MNEEKHRKGKEYLYNSTLIFDGEYLKGEKNGKGKEYDKNGDLIFDGKYLNGKGGTEKEKNMMVMID